MNTQSTTITADKNTYIPTLGGMCRPAKCPYALEFHSMKAQLEQAQIKIKNKELKIKQLEEELAKTKGSLHLFARMLFGRKSEKTPQKDKPCDEKVLEPDEVIPPQEANQPKRGAKKGHKGHGRKIPDNLQIITQTHEVPHESSICPICGKPFSKTGLYEESYEITMQVHVTLIKHKRERLFRECNCSNLPVIVTAPLPPKVIPKCMFSHEFIAHVLTYKYGFQLPLSRIILMLKLEGLKVNIETLCGIFKKLNDILHPLYLLLKSELKEEKLWNVDETSFYHFGSKMEFTEVETKPSQHWWLWVFNGPRITFFALDPSRSSNVPNQTLGQDVEGTMISDHFTAYTKYIKGASGISHALCWAHFRRFFKQAAMSYPNLADWSSKWVSRIAKIYHLNCQRLKVINNCEQFKQAQKELETGISDMRLAIEQELKNPNLHKRQFQILTTAIHNWKAYTLFISDYRIPMDNNEAERALRPAALGRKNWYGVHTNWSGTFAAMMMTIIQTPMKNGLNPVSYIIYLLDKFAEYEDNPRNLQELLPWNIPKDILDKYNMHAGRGSP